METTEPSVMESFNTLIATVEGNLSKEKSENVESAISHLKVALEKH